MKRPVVMILLAGALTLSMIAPSALPAAGNISVAQAAVKASNDAAVKTSNDVTAETSSDEDAGEWKDKTETVYVDANADGSVKKITVKDWLRRNGDGEIIDFSNLKDIKTRKETKNMRKMQTELSHGRTKGKTFPMKVLPISSFR